MKSPKVLLILLIIILSTVLTINAAGILNISGDNNYTEAWKVVGLVNEYRTAEGLEPVVMDTILLDAAMERAAELSVFYSHTRPDDTECFTILNWRHAVGENIAIMNYISDADDAMTGWMNSQGHKNNILFESFKSIGVGVFELDGNQYWVQLFDGGPPREASNDKTLESANFEINVHNSKLNPQTLQNTSVSFQSCDPLSNGETFTIDGIYNVNIGWDFASLIINKANISYKSADPKIAEVDDNGTITPKSLGNVSVTAYLTNFPDKAITYKVSVTEHEFTDWTITKNPTCIHDGEGVLKCKNCTETQTQIIAATGKHTYGSGIIIEKPNCTTAGKMQYTCTTPGCELYYIEAIPMTGDHKYDSGVIQDDEIIYSCQTPECTASYVEKIEAVTEPETEPETDIETELEIISETEVTETIIPEEQSDPIESNEITETEPEEEQSTNVFRITLTVIVFITAVLLLITVRLINVPKKKINKKTKRKRM